MRNIELKNLTKQELIDKVIVLLGAIHSDTPKGQLKFGLKANWNEDGMNITVGIEDTSPII